MTRNNRLRSQVCVHDSLLRGAMSIPELARSNWISLGLVAVVATVTLACFLILQTMPPRTLVMATGPEGGAYHELGKRYQAILARSGVRLQLLSTSGALETLALLRDPHSRLTVAL